MRWWHVRWRWWKPGSSPQTLAFPRAPTTGLNVRGPSSRAKLRWWQGRVQENILLQFPCRHSQSPPRHKVIFQLIPSHWNIVNKKNKLKLPQAIFTDFLGQQSAVKNNFSVYPQSLHLPGWRFKTLWLLSGVDKLVAGRPCPEVGSIINLHSTSLWPRLVTGTAFTTSTSLVTWPPAG